MLFVLVWFVLLDIFYLVISGVLSLLLFFCCCCCYRQQVDALTKENELLKKQLKDANGELEVLRAHRCTPFVSPQPHKQSLSCLSTCTGSEAASPAFTPPSTTVKLPQHQQEDTPQPIQARPNSGDSFAKKARKSVRRALFGKNDVQPGEASTAAKLKEKLGSPFEMASLSTLLTQLSEKPRSREPSPTPTQPLAQSPPERAPCVYAVSEPPTSRSTHPDGAILHTESFTQRSTSIPASMGHKRLSPIPQTETVEHSSPHLDHRFDGYYLISCCFHATRHI